MSTHISTPTLPVAEPNLGYFVTSNGDPATDGLAPVQLHVILRDKETDAHYDPAFIHLPMADQREGMRLVTLGLAPTTEQARQVCMGRIVLKDTVQKQVHLFSFGGQLTVTVSQQPDSAMPCKTEYILASTAPILILSTDQRDTANQLADEIQSTLARIRAGWGRADTEFWHRLAHVDPALAYVGGVKEIHDRYAHVSALGQEFPRLARFLSQEEKRLKDAGVWTAETTTLSDLLAPDLLTSDLLVSDRTK